MRFKAGESGNPNGRPAGSVNLTTKVGRELSVNFCAENREQFHEDYLKLKPRDRCLIYLKVLEFALPKLRAVEIQAELKPFDPSAFLRLSEKEQLLKIPELEAPKERDEGELFLICKMDCIRRVT